MIVTGKITSYPARSSYQIVIETMEAAGAGALLAQLERLKAKLAGEGLFEPSRKRPIPTFPAVIGVITSPTGAVIRDILHRIAERWPCRVIVWPVVVQGDAACGQVSNAIRGFDAMRPDGPIPRPDILIVARGGGSVEDLWCFNDEGLARTVASASIPIISAVGHETDTTLIDFVSDRRAPTPTGAAEIATPVLADLRYALSDLDRRLARAGGRILEDRRTRLRAASRGLPSRPEDLLALPQQRLDHAGSRLESGLTRNVTLHERALVGASSRLTPALLDRAIERRQDRLESLSARLRSGLETNLLAHRHQLGRILSRLSPDLLNRRFELGQARIDSLGTRLDALPRRLEVDKARLAALARALSSLNPTTPKPGFARIEGEDGAMIATAAALSDGQAVRLVFADGARGARIDGEEAALPRAKPALIPRAKAPPAGQGDLF